MREDVGLASPPRNGSRVRILVLWADDRAPNLGVRVLGAGTEALARRVWPDAEFVMYNYRSAAAPIPLGSMKSLGREALTRQRGLGDWFRSFDLVLDTRAGDSFTDIYGLGRLRSMAAAAEYAVRAGTPVVLSPQTIGPFASRTGRAIAKRSLSSASLVMARDTASAAEAIRLGRHVDVVTTDVVFALDVPKPGRQRDAVLNVSGLLWQPNPHVDVESYRATVREIHDALVADGRTVTLLAHVLPSNSPDDDVPALKAFRQEHAPTSELLIPRSLPEVRQVLAGAALVIGSRMHACLNALSVGTPALPLAYSRKFAPLLADLGWSHVVDLRAPTDAVQRVRMLSDSDGIAGQVAEVRERAAARLQLATELLAGDRPSERTERDRTELTLGRSRVSSRLKSRER